MRTAFIVPAYNEEKACRHRGEYVDFAIEIAVVDDGPADWTSEVGKKCVNNKIELFWYDANRGLFNIGEMINICT